MFKKGPLSKIECFYIQQNHNKIEVSQLSSDLNRPIDIIEKWIKKNITEAPSVMKAGDHFAKSKGSVIMTENVSALSDSKRKRHINNSQCVTKIKND
jgi:hypothetical protein